MPQSQIEQIEEAFKATHFSYVIDLSKKCNPNQRKRLLDLIPLVDLTKNVRQRYVNMKDKALVDNTVNKILQEISVAEAKAQSRRIRYIRSFNRKTV